MSRIRDTVREHLDAGRPDLAVDAVIGAMNAGPPQERHSARRMLAWCAEHVPSQAWSADARRAALRAGVAVEPSGPQPGVAWFPAVRGPDGRWIRVRARRLDREAEGGIFCGVSASQRSLVERAIQVVRTHVDHQDAVEVVFDHLDWEGESAGLAVALAVWSACTGTALDARTLATGALDDAGQVLDVGSRTEKLKLLAPTDARVLVPLAWPGTDPREVPVGSFQAAVRTLAPSDDMDVDRLLSRVRDQAGGGQWADAARGALLLLEGDQLEGDEPIELLGVAMKAATATCSRALQLQCLAAAGTISDLGRSPEGIRVVGSAGVAAIDRLDPEGARQWLDLGELDTLPRHERPHLLGPRAMLAILEGRYDDAVDLRTASMELSPRSERARCRGDLADALRRAGRLEQACAEAARAVEEALGGGRHRAYQKLTLAYLHLHHARTLAAVGRVDEALATLDDGRPPAGLDPAFRYGLLRAELLGEPALVAQACARVPLDISQVPILAALRWRTRSRLHLESGAPDIACFRGLAPDEVWGRIPY